MERYLKETNLLNYSDISIQQLVKDRDWNNLSSVEKVKSIYNFVRDEIKFGYNTADNILASKVLHDGYGQCNTKATLLMALLRAVGIPNRIHGFTINKALQKGALTGLWYKLSPSNILHTWVEIYVNNQWYSLEGVIIDKMYLQKLQVKNQLCKNTFCGYGVFTDNFRNLVVDWNLNSTFIQDKGINNDFGVFDSPDEFYKIHQQNIGIFKKLIFLIIVRHLMNKNVQKIRNSK